MELCDHDFFDWMAAPSSMFIKQGFLYLQPRTQSAGTK